MQKKDPSDYTVNHLNKKILMLNGAKAMDVIPYYNTDKGVSIDFIEISVKKYQEIFLGTGQ